MSTDGTEQFERPLVEEQARPENVYAVVVTLVQRPSEPEKPPSDGGVEWKDVAAIGAAATAIVTVIAGLAVTGALQHMQRDHGYLLIAALSAAVAAAAVWLVLAIFKATLAKHQDWWRALHVAATVLFAAGVGAGIVGMVMTQADRPRPSVTASFDPETMKLDATSEVHNLGINGRLVTLIIGLKDAPDGSFTKQNQYVAVSGPDTDGNVTQHVVLTLPKRLFSRVGISASAGEGDRCNYSQAADASASGKITRPIESVIAQQDQPGCAVIVLP